VIKAMQGGTPSARLTSRQAEILQLLAEGRSSKEVAAALDLSPRTVESHKYAIMEALGVKTSAELVREAVKRGLVCD
jgi:DNA-binding NarL/FixJ family response regulator